MGYLNGKPAPHYVEGGKIQVGSQMTYPCSDHRFFNTMEITEEVARGWLDSIDYKLNKLWASGSAEPRGSFGNNESWLQYRYNFNQWLNKLGVVVSIQRAKAFAVYKHDFKFWLIEKELCDTHCLSGKCGIKDTKACEFM